MTTHTVDPVELIEDRATDVLHTDPSISRFADARMRVLAAATPLERANYFATLLGAYLEIKDQEREARLNAMVATAVAKSLAAAEERKKDLQT